MNPTACCQWFVRVAVVGWCLPMAIGAADRPPNLIFLMTDDQRYDSLGCTGNPVVRTPSIDDLARRGVTFDRSFVTTAICMTSRASVMTGQYAARHGVWDFSTPLTPGQLSETYLGRLRDAGYRTGFVGKWGVGHPSSGDAVLDFNRGFPGQAAYFEPDADGKPGRHLTSRLGDDAIEFIRSCDDEQPFHLSVSFKAPHCQDSLRIDSDQFPADPRFDDQFRDVVVPPPATAAAEYYERLPVVLKNSLNRDRWAVRFRSPERYQQSVKDYYRLIGGVDEAVGRIVDALRRAGHADNTIIVYTSDHGFFLGEYGLAGKWTPHDVSIRTPLIIHDPRRPETAGTRRDEIVLNIDMAPTLLAYAGIEPPAGMQGRSLRQIVEGRSPEDWRTSFFYEHLFTAGGRLPPCEGVRDGRWKYCRYLAPESLDHPNAPSDPAAVAEELYDLQTDPNETTNLATDAAFVDTLKAQREGWSRWRRSVREPIAR